jgi:hypothetical protein
MEGLGGISTLELLIRAGRIGCLLVERLPIPDAPTHELWPSRNCESRRLPLRQQRPQIRVMPAELMATGVSVLAYRYAQPLNLGD